MMAHNNSFNNNDTNNPMKTVQKQTRRKKKKQQQQKKSLINKTSRTLNYKTTTKNKPNTNKHTTKPSLNYGTPSHRKKYIKSKTNTPRPTTKPNTHSTSLRAALPLYWQKTCCSQTEGEGRFTLQACRKQSCSKGC